MSTSKIVARSLAYDKCFHGNKGSILLSSVAVDMKLGLKSWSFDFGNSFYQKWPKFSVIE